MPRANLPAAVLLLLAAGCGGDSDPRSDADAGAPDAALDLSPVAAVPGDRCAAEDRVGIVEVTVGRVVRADLFDRSDPWIAAPVLADGSCALHRFEVQQCDGCADDEICGADARCTRIPRRDPAGRLVVRAAGDEQVFEAEPTTGELGGAITLPGDRFALEVVAFGQTVTLAGETGVPDPLPGFSAMLLGTYDAPEGIAATWDPVPDGSHLFTRIPINHHAAGPTFTECAGDGSAGSLDISQPMLEPLAVATGLEFQFFDHVRFAAAETSRGCVEIRFSNRQSVGLEGV
ncbi:MAG TPA: hypothetical protein VFU21_33525 [Kofleriaceae bacterium]|nr:hypothetical protein [Kofleriaceae bacterium]